MRAKLAIVLGLVACQPAPSIISGGSTDSGPSAGTKTSGGSSSTAGAASTSIGSGSATDQGLTMGPTMGSAMDSAVDSATLGSSGADSETTVATEGSGSSGDSTGDPSPIGCADGTRDALADEVLHPDIAACAGGFGVPGVNIGMPVCDRQGGNDGPLPDGVGCSIDDLCAAGWHLCASRNEVMTAGLTDCDALAWGSQFFATAQSGTGDNACAAMGANDVFGCGDIGHANIRGCAPLNRSTSNLCTDIIGPWDCLDDAYNEASNLTKSGPENGGALCCRD
ncbi:MAG: hypothetical protein AAGF11_22245 [Myxococcota bacterium]